MRHQSSEPGIVGLATVPSHQTPSCRGVGGFTCEAGMGLTAGSGLKASTLDLEVERLVGGPLVDVELTTIERSREDGRRAIGAAVEVRDGDLVAITNGGRLPARKGCQRCNRHTVRRLRATELCRRGDWGDLERDHLTCVVRNERVGLGSRASDRGAVAKPAERGCALGVTFRVGVGVVTGKVQTDVGRTGDVDAAGHRESVDRDTIRCHCRTGAGAGRRHRGDLELDHLTRVVRDQR